MKVPNEVLPIVESIYVQRLRNISQTARASAAYPSLNGSRYEHALGTMHLAARAWSSAWSNVVGESSTYDKSEMQAAFSSDIYADLVNNWDELDAYTRTLVASPESDKGQQEQAKRRFSDECDTLVRNCVAVIGLLHDIGHPPFSHILEDSYRANADTLLGATYPSDYEEYLQSVSEDATPQFHEFAGYRILQAMIKNDAALFSRLSTYMIRRIFGARDDRADWASCLHDIIDGEFDVDRLDYIVRDSQRAGTDYSAIDSERLLDSFELHRLAEHRWQVGVGVRAVSAVESLLIQRVQSYRWVTFHPKALIADTCLRRSVDFMLADSTSSPDHALQRPNLDYVTKWEGRFPESYGVDDHRVTEWMRNYRRSRANDGYEPALQRFEAYARVADEGSTHYTACWRSYGEFVQALEVVSGAWLGSPSALEGPQDDARNPLDDSTGASSASFDSIAVRFTAKFVNLRKWKVGSDDDDTLDVRLEKRLNAERAVVEEVRGVWVVADRLKFNAIKPAFSAVLWSGNESIGFDELSPMQDGLKSSEAMRPTVWPFFIPFRPEGRKPSQEAVAQAFLECIEEIDNERGRK